MAGADAYLAGKLVGLLTHQEMRTSKDGGVEDVSTLLIEVAGWYSRDAERELSATV